MQLCLKLSPPSKSLPPFSLFILDDMSDNRNLCGMDWANRNKKGKRADFVCYWRDNIAVRDKIVRSPNVVFRLFSIL